ncbi:MAG: DUF2283 domain-containing protein [Thermoanaerobaculia bacterium]|nr:DUF2283 domain-containing protein [Thermoanaerobaculia bacterium]
MKITYDRDADALYIRLKTGTEEIHVNRVSEDVACDLDEEGRVVGIEVLRASTVFDRPQAPSVELEYLAPRTA